MGSAARAPQRVFWPVFGLGLEREDSVAEVPLVPRVVDMIETDSMVNIAHKGNELRHRPELRPDVRRLAVEQGDDVERLRKDRVKAVRAHVVQADPRTSQTSSGAQLVNLFVSTRSKPTDLLCVRHPFEVQCLARRLLPKTTRCTDDFPTFRSPARRIGSFGSGRWRLEK